MESKYFTTFCVGCVLFVASFSNAQNCSATCEPSLHNDTESCDVIFGECLFGCVTGYAGPNCSFECPQSCSISVQNGSDVCYPDTGNCTHGCLYGYSGPNCSIECPENCSMHLDDVTETCDASTLECSSGCMDGFMGPQCMTACPENCLSNKCNASTGECLLGCIVGYAGENCSYACPDNCLPSMVNSTDMCNTTSGECLLGCQVGYAGDNCSYACPDNCLPLMVNGTDMCNTTSGECLLGCQVGYAGDDCSYTCPDNCHPSTVSGADMCNITSGECLAGCKYGFTGSNCSTPCPTNCAPDLQYTNLEVCSADTNECLFGCIYGFSGQDCSIECPSNCGMYPAEGPQMTCNESSLVCTNGCNVTYTGPYCNESCSTGCNRCDNPTECTECKTEFYRSNEKCYNCPWQCSPPSQTNTTLSTCRETDGRCEFGCIDGYYGLRCKDRCSSTCKDDLCERVGGTCTLGCVTNDFTGLTCDKRCNDGCIQLECNQQGACLHGCDTLVWGDLCDEPCNANCNIAPPGATNVCNRSDGTCLYGCKNDIYWDNQCTEACSAYCFNGTCDQMTGNCSNGCNSDTVYGMDCETPCNENCLNGTCFRDGGECKLGCEDGWYGEHCDKECGANCFNDVCDRDDGTCLNDCDNQWYGSYCTELCSLTCVNRTCYMDTGNCSLGCVFGSAGAKCDIVDIPPTHGPPEEIDTVWIYVGIGIGAAIIIGIMITIILVARRRKIIIERRRRTTMYENFPDGQNGTQEVETRRKKKKGPVARITQLLVENPLALLMRGNRDQNSDDDTGAFTNIAVDDLLELVIQAEESGGNEEFERLKSGLTKPHEESRKLENLALNFFGRVYPYDENRVILGQGRKNVQNGVEQRGIIKTNAQNERKGTGRSVHFKQFRLSASYSLNINNAINQDTEGKDTTVQQENSSDNNDGVVVLNAKRDENAHVQTRKDTSSPQTRDYINASYIKAQDGTVGFIATQAPAKSAVNDFWLMVWEQSSPMIVMLTSIVDDETSQCERYWPDTGSSATYGSIQVTCESCDEYVIQTIRRLTIKHDNEDEVINVVHHQFTDWPDNGCPASAISFIDFHQKYRSIKDTTSKTGPVVVHCTAGIGRTGVFIGLDYLYDEGLATGYVNIYKCVENLREQRVDMVHGSHQYDFLYKALAQTFALECQLVNRSSLQDALTRLRTVDIEHGGNSRLDYLFKNIRDSLVLDTSDIATLDVIQERRRKDRPTSDVPDMKYRADLPNGSYINAVVFNTYKQRDTMVATQMPTPETLGDFCQLILHRKCETVVMLNQCDPNDKTLGYYWTKHKKHITIGNLKITNIEEDKKSDVDYIMRTLKIEQKQENTVHEVTMIQYKGWKTIEHVPTTNNLLHLIKLCRQYVNKSSDRRLLVHCMNGSEQSGLVCALYNILDQLDTENEICITSIVRHILARLPAAITSAEQLEACFSVACTYIAESALSQD
ncbi:Tyrosine-protein phosphatase non-receptor type 4 [Mactra antiquata]